MNTRAPFPAKRIFFITSIITVLLSAVLRTLSMVFFYDTSAGYFSVGAVLPIISNVCLVLSVICAATLAIVSFKKSESLVATPSTSILNVASSIIAALGLLGLGISDFIFAAGYFAIILDIIAAVYFALCAFKTNPYLKVCGGFLFIVRLALLIYKTHFDWTSPTNAPEKLLFLIACGFVVIFISQELKCFTNTAKPALYLFSAVSTACVGISTSLSVLVSYYCGVLSTGNGSYAQFYVILTISAYAAIRAINTFRTINNERND